MRVKSLERMWVFPESSGETMYAVVVSEGWYGGMSN